MPQYGLAEPNDLQSFETQGLALKSQFISSHSDEMGELRKKWGNWAMKTCMCLYSFN